MTPIGTLAGPIVRLQPDSRLVALTREGHELAFNEIVRRYRATLVRFAAGIGPRSSAEDVVQEALARAHVAITDSDAEIKLRPWLYTIVRNRALNARRDERPYEQLDPEYDGVPQPPTIAAEREELAATIAAIQALPAQQRDAIVMRELEGMSHEDIAAHLGVSRGSVRQLIFRARTTLRDGLGSLVPLPVVRSLLESDAARVATAGVGAGAVVAAGGGGGALGIKGGVALLVAGLAIGSGVAIHDHGKNHDGDVALAAPAHHGSGLKAKEAASVSSSGHQKAFQPGDDSSGDASERRDAGEDSDSHNRGPGGDDSSGHGGSGEDSGETEHHGGGGGSGSDDGPGHEGGGEDHSGPGGGGDDGPGDEGSSSSGSGGGGAGDDVPTGGGDDSGSGSSGPGSGDDGLGDSGHGGSDDGVTDDPPADELLPDGD
jgi:RNA polymerase sigma factor (sigma-70 family)